MLQNVAVMIGIVRMFENLANALKIKIRRMRSMVGQSKGSITASTWASASATANVTKIIKLSATQRKRLTRIVLMTIMLRE